MNSGSCSQISSSCHCSITPRTPKEHYRQKQEIPCAYISGTTNLDEFSLNFFLHTTKQTVLFKFRLTFDHGDNTVQNKGVNSHRP